MRSNLKTVVVMIVGVVTSVFEGVISAQPIDPLTAAETYRGGGLALTAVDLRRISGVPSTGMPDTRGEGHVRGGGVGSVFVVECGGAYGYSSIQEAIDAAADGDVVVVLPNDCTADGHWHENIDFLGKAIRVQNANLGDEAVVEATVIESATCGEVVTFTTDETRESELAGFVLLQCDDDLSPTIRCNRTSPTIRKCRVRERTTGGDYQGAVFITGGAPSLVECRFDVAEGAINRRNAIRSDHSDVELLGCEFIGYAARAVEVAGTSSLWTAPRIESCVFRSNPGGGLQLYAGGTMEVVNCDFVENGSSALRLESDGYGQPVHLVGCRFIRNRLSDHVVHGGGAIYIGTPFYQPRQHLFEDCVFVENVADFPGAPIGGAIFVENLGFGPVLRLQYCDFVGNHTEYTGGAVGGASFGLEVSGCRLVGNSAVSDGGAIWIGQSSNPNSFLTVWNSVLVGNSSRSGANAISARVGTSVVGSTFRENFHNGSTGPHLPWTVTGLSIAVDDSIFWNNGYVDETIGHPLPWTGDVLTLPEYLRFSILQGWYPIDDSTNSNSNPLFAGTLTGQWTADAIHDADTAQTTLFDDNATWQPGELDGRYLRPTLVAYHQTLVVSNTSTSVTVWGDVSDLGLAGSSYEIDDAHLSAASPAIDAGNPDYIAIADERDIDGEPRVMSCRVDIGADEVTQPEPIAGDMDGNGIVDLMDVPEFIEVMLAPSVQGVCRADVNGDGLADGRDVAAMVEMVVSG